MTAPDVDETPVVADPTVCDCGRTLAQHGPIGRSGIRKYTCRQIGDIEARVAFSELAWWQQWLRRKPAGWRSR